MMRPRHGVIAFPSRKLAFYIIPKNASVSLRQCLRESTGGLDDRMDLVLNEPSSVYKYIHDWNKYMRVAIVRNPVRRLYSAYFDKLVSADKLDKGPMTEMGLYLGMPRSEFVSCVLNIEEDRMDKHVLPQYRFTHMDAGRPLITRYVKLEMLDQAWPVLRKEVFNWCGLNLDDMPHKNATKKYRGGFTQQEKQQIQRRYARDYQLFGH